MAKKVDVVIESVRYDPEGRLAEIRLYERRGPVYSDRMVVDRDNLLQRLKKGKRVVTGRRKQYLASSFDVDKEVRAHGKDGQEWIATGDSANGRDSLDGVPLF